MTDIRMRSSELPMLSFGIPMNILVTALVWSSLPWPTESTLQLLKLCTWRWVALLQAQPVLAKPKQLRIYQMVLQRLAMCSTVQARWTTNQWVTFIRVSLHQDVGDASTNSTGCFPKCCLSALCSSRASLMPSRKTRKDSFFKAMRFPLIRLAVCLSQWTQVISVELSYQKVWKPFSGLSLWSSLICNSSVKTCWWLKVSLMPKC